MTKGVGGLTRGGVIEPRTGTALAGGVYVLWACLLFFEHASILSSLKFLYAGNPVIASFGVYLLSRRWVAGWTPSVLAGLVYGFGPFGLSFMNFHPIAGLTFAAVPWTLLPAAYWQRGRTPHPYRFVIRAVLCLLPFAFMIGFFWLLTRHWVGPVFILPKHIQLTIRDFAGFVMPLSMTGYPVILGLFHIGTLIGLMGLFMYVSAQRVAILMPPVIGLVLAFLDPICRVSPVVWAALPMVFCAILVGLGVQGLYWAGRSDGTWVVFCILAGLLPAGVMAALYLPGRAELYRLPTLFYTAGIIGLGVLYTLTRVGLRWLPIRWLILAGLIATDCFLAGRWIVERLL